MEFTTPATLEVRLNEPHFDGVSALSDPLAPSQGVNEPKIRSLTIARPACLLHTQEFWKNEILMGAPIVARQADLTVVEIEI
jgi:hypothetical protein